MPTWSSETLMIEFHPHCDNICQTMKTLLLALLAILVVPVPTAENHDEKAPHGNATQSAGAPEYRPVDGDENRPGRNKDSPKPSHDWPELVNAVSTLVIALFTIVTSVAIFCQVKTARNTDRAWVIILPMAWNPGVQRTKMEGAVPLNVFNASVKNIGRTPAKILELSVKYVMLDKEGLKGLPANPEYPECARFDSLLLVPQEFIYRVETLSPTPVLTEKLAQAVEGGKLFLYAYGYVVYADVFGKKRETRRGYLYDFPPGLQASVHNASFRQWGPSAYNHAT
jgi:hypothetical protein